MRENTSAREIEHRLFVADMMKEFVHTPSDILDRVLPKNEEEYKSFIAFTD